MATVSAFLIESPRGRGRAERRYYFGFSASLALGGLSLLILPVFNRAESVTFAAGWLLFLAALLSLLRPMLFRRGFPDLTEGLIAAAFYGFFSVAVSGPSLSMLSDYRLALGALLIFWGFSRLLVFFRMLSAAPLPLMLTACVADLAAGVFIVLEIPSGRLSLLCWYTGMLLLIDAAEAFAEAVLLRRRTSS